MHKEKQFIKEVEMTELKPHEEILHKIPHVLIAGKGWVGTEVAKHFPNAVQVDENNSCLMALINLLSAQFLIIVPFSQLIISL